MSEMLFITQEELEAVGNAVRNKTGKTEALTLDTLINEIDAIELGVDTTDATALASDILQGKTAYVNEEKIEGTIPTKTATDLSVNGATVTVPAGYYEVQATKNVATVSRANTTISTDADDTNDTLTITASNNQGTGYVTGADRTASSTVSLTVSGATVTASNGEKSISKSVATATQATPTISVDSTGKITATSTQSAGYVTAGTKTATQQLAVQAAQTITPGTSNKTIASGRYLTGTQTIAGDADLKATNIKKGVNIFGVAGSYSELGFTIVGGTTRPSNPADRTIWINTGNAITSYCFSSTKPVGAEGKVWFEIGTNSPGDFNALSGNTLMVYPNHAEQYKSGAWAPVEGFIYENGAWTQFAFTILWLYRNGDRNVEVTGDYYRNSPTSGITVPDGTTTDGVTYLDLPNKSNESLYKAYTVYTGKMIDITAFTTLKSKSKHGRAGDRIQIRTSDLEIAAESASTTTSSDFQYPELDVSAFTGAYYISLYNFNNGYDNYDLYELCLE